MRPDFHLITLGRLGLESAEARDDAGLNRQRRKLAVLAVLALSRRPVSRDLLLEMFWGEQDGTRARHSLSDALSHLRRVLGPGAVSARHAEVSLAPGAPLRVDALEFIRAVEEEDDDSALSLYRGHFLEAVYVGGSPRFEQWVEGEARRLERLFCVTCERRCELLEAGGEWDACAAVARRWAEADPLSTDAALTLLSALRGVGGRERELRALEEAERLRERVTREFGVEPDARIAEFAAALRARLGPADSGRRAERHDPVEDDAPPPPAPIDVRDAFDSPRRRSSRAARLRMRPAALATGTAVLALLLLLLVLRPAAPPGSPAAIVIFPFSVKGAEEFGYLGEGMVDLLSTNLDGAGGLHTIDPRAVLALTSGTGDTPHTADRGSELARRLGARRFVLGDVIEAGGRLRVTAAMYDAAGADEPLTRAYAEGEADSLFSMVDGLTFDLLAHRAQGIGGRLARIATLTTSSIPALKAYLEGERHWRSMRLVEAVEALRRATAQDSTFALAWYRLGVASSWDARVDVAEEAMDRAVRLSTALPERDRALIAAYRDVVARDMDGAEHRYREVAARYPSDVEAWAGLGEVWFHGNPSRGRSFEQSRTAWERVLRLEPMNVSAMWHLAYVSARQGRKVELDSLTRSIQQTVAGGPDLSVRAIRAVALGGPPERASLLPDLNEADDISLVLAVWRVAVTTEDLEAVVQLARPLTAAVRPPEVRALGHALLAHLHLGRGQLRAASAELDSLATLDPTLAVEYRTLFALHPMLGADPERLQPLRAGLEAWDGRGRARVASPADLWVNAHVGTHAQLREYLLSLLAARMNDEREAEGRLATLRGLAATGEAAELARAHARELQAELEMARGHPVEALAALESERDVVDYGFARVSPFFARSRQRFLRGELLRQAGREEEALGWYGALSQIYPFDVIYLAPAYLRREAILRARGESEAAREAHARAAALWKDADPELRRWLQPR